jgi:type IV secretory pathway TrbD component
MMHIMSAVTSPAVFGRDGAMFESLLGFVSQLSVALWGLVILTLVIRFVGIWMYRRGAARTARVQTVVPNAPVSAAAVSTTAVQAEIDLVRSGAGSGVVVPRAA